MEPSRIITLARVIEANATKVDEYLAKNNLPAPSFDEDAPLMYQFPPDIAEAQDALSAAIDELLWLNQGPIQTIVSKSVCFLMTFLTAQRVTDTGSLRHPLVSKQF